MGQLPWRRSGGSSTGHTSSDHVTQQPRVGSLPRELKAGPWRGICTPRIAQTQHVPLIGSAWNSPMYRISTWRGDGQGWGRGRTGGCGVKEAVGEDERCEDGWRWRRHSSVSALHSREPCTQRRLRWETCVRCVLQFEKIEPGRLPLPEASTKGCPCSVGRGRSAPRPPVRPQEHSPPSLPPLPRAPTPDSAETPGEQGRSELVRPSPCCFLKSSSPKTLPPLPHCHLTATLDPGLASAHCLPHREPPSAASRLLLSLHTRPL